MVSVLKFVGMLLATRRPSCNAMSAPATLVSCVVRCTISFGVHAFLSGSLKSSDKLLGTFLGAVTVAATGGTEADCCEQSAPACSAAAGVGAAGCSGLSGEGAGGNGLPVALKRSGMLSATAVFLRR